MGSILFLDSGAPVDNEYSEGFRSASTQELIDKFNRDVGCTAWVSARGRFHAALRYEIAERGLQLGDGQGINMAHRIKLSDDGKSLVRESYTD